MNKSILAMSEFQWGTKHPVRHVVCPNHTEIPANPRIGYGILFALFAGEMTAVVAHADKEIESVAREITDYLSLNPDAADTLDGIVTWWVERQRRFEAQSMVEAALQYLVEHGHVERQQMLGGAVVYKKKG